MDGVVVHVMLLQNVTILAGCRTALCTRSITDHWPSIVISEKSDFLKSFFVHLE